MAAYAALASVIHIIERIHNQASQYSAFLDKIQIDSLHEKVVFLLDFIEDYSHGGSTEAHEFLEIEIAYAAYAAEDLIESCIVNQILSGNTPQGEKIWKSRYDTYLMDFLSGLQKVMTNLDSIMKRVMKVEGKKGFKDQQQPAYSMPSTSSRHDIPTTTMVGLDDDLIQLMERLIGQISSRQVIPIVGMGGIGKTTLAKNVYENPIIVQHFDIRAWITISHSYSVREVLLELVSCCINQGSTSEDLVASTSEMDKLTEDKLGELLYKSLSGRRYLIIMDDIWSTEAWENIKLFLPDNGHGSRIVVTTRLSNMAVHFGSMSHEMNFLDEVKSWNLFCEKAFAQEGCPPELEEVGKKIAKKCKGLPLLIVVIGGLLGKSYRTLEYWENVAENINSFLNSGDDEHHSLDILSLSYSHLPAHLKPCFLYMGIFPEDHEIHVSRLIKLWVAEGFLRPNNAKSLEDVAEDYLTDLIGRNLILVGKQGSYGKITSCRIHDTLRDLCLKVARKEKFLLVKGVDDISEDIYLERRIVLHDNVREKPLFENFQKTSITTVLGDPRNRLLRVLHAVERDDLEGVFNQVNLRYVAYHAPIWGSESTTAELPSSISLLWNLQTLVGRGAFVRIVAPSQIWKMRQLRHLEFDEIDLPPVPVHDDSVVLENLQTLLTVVNFTCTDEIVERIPNIKKLKIKYDKFSRSYHCLHNLGRFKKLESLYCSFYEKPNKNEKNLTFPDSLKKLTLINCNIHWEDLAVIGLLPHLEVLKLVVNNATGSEWSPIDGQFICLKFLEISSVDLWHWNADSSHFPVLEKLVLERVWVSEIPPGIGDIPTLKLIHLRYCTYPLAVSAKNILEEQESLGNEGLQVLVWHRYMNEIQNLATENFRVVKRTDLDWERTFGYDYESYDKFRSFETNGFRLVSGNYGVEIKW